MHNSFSGQKRVSIKEIKENGPADLSRKMRTGDIILEVNGEAVMDKSEDFIKHMIQDKRELSLLMERGCIKEETLKRNIDLNKSKFFSLCNYLYFYSYRIKKKDSCFSLLNQSVI